jgi:hypothetical protein
MAELGAAFLCADLDLTLEPREDPALWFAKTSQCNTRHQPHGSSRLCWTELSRFSASRSRRKAEPSACHEVMAKDSLLMPPHLLTLVHAVQQPLGRPAFSRLTAQFNPVDGHALQTELETAPTAGPSSTS